MSTELMISRRGFSASSSSPSPTNGQNVLAAIITTIYVAVNIACLKILPVEAVAATERIGIVVADRMLGPLGAAMIAVIILISITGSANGSVLAPARIYFAQARDGLFFSRFDEVHPRFETPSFSIFRFCSP